MFIASIGVAGNSPSAPVDTTGANFLVAGISGGAPSAQAPIDNYLNTWVGLTTWGASFAGSLRLWYVANPIVGPGHTIQGSGGQDATGVTMIAFDSMLTSGVFDQESGQSNVASPNQAGSLTPPSAAVFIAAIGGLNGAGSTVGSGFAITDQFGIVGALNYGIAIAYKIVAAGAEDPQWIWSSPFGGDSAIALATFLQAGAPPPSTIRNLPLMGAG